jgi:hypothetical protein
MADLRDPIPVKNASCESDEAEGSPKHWITKTICVDGNLSGDAERRMLKASNAIACSEP